MNIAFDAKRAFLNKSGLGNYSRTLIKSVVDFFPEHHYSLFTTKKEDSVFTDFISKKSNVNLLLPDTYISKSIPSLWRTFEVTDQLTKGRIEVFHGLSNELPLNIQKFNGKKIVTIHDLIFLRYPELYPIIDREIYFRKSLKACQKADVIISISEQTKNDIIHFLKIPEKKIKVVYQACDEIFSNALEEVELKKVKEKYDLPSNYLLSVGTIEERKNLLTTVKALNLVDDVKLIVVGKKRDYFKTVMSYLTENNLLGRVQFLENVLTEDLPAIYKLAKIFIYPSHFEGFGIPILEALTCGTPVVAANGSSLAEAGGEHSIYFKSTDYTMLADEITTLLSSSALRKSLSEKGIEYAKRFAPQNLAKEIMKIYIE